DYLLLHGAATVDGDDGGNNGRDNRNEDDKDNTSNDGDDNGALTVLEAIMALP
ncbi:hypothetical protein THAOC_05264, partial [Thalassiosira oceanica]